MQKKPNTSLITPFNLGTVGRDYVQSRLKKAGDLSVLVNALFGNTGDVFAPLPQGLKSDRAERFEHGDYLPPGEIIEWLATHITSINASANCQLVFEDVWTE